MSGNQKIGTSSCLGGEDVQEERKAAGGKSLRGYTSASFESEHTMATAHRARNRTVRNFLRDTRAAATAIVAAVASVMVVGGAALVVDHSWLVDQRDTLKSASVAASIAATLEMGRAPTDLSPETLKARLEVVARRYVLLNLAYLSPERLQRASESLTLSITPDRVAGTVRVVASADLGGTLLSQHLPLLGGYSGPGPITVDVGTEREVKPVEVVLAIDVTTSMSYGVGGSRPANPSDSRMAIVKKAAKELAETLLTDVDAPVAVALVPWNFTVRLSETTRTKWVDENWAVYPTTQEYPYPYRGWRSGAAVIQAVPKLADIEWLGCLQQRSLSGENPPGIEPDPPSTERFTQAFFPPAQRTVYQCYTEPFPSDYEYQVCYDESSVTRPQFDEDNNRIPGGKHIHRIPVQYGCHVSMASMMALSRSARAISTAIDAMTPVGSNTYSSLGLIWGRRMLDPTWRTVWGGGGDYPPRRSRRSGQRGCAQGHRAPHRRRRQLGDQRFCNVACGCVQGGEGQRHGGLRRRGDGSEPVAQNRAQEVLERVVGIGHQVYLPRQPDQRRPARGVPQHHE